MQRSGRPDIIVRISVQELHGLRSLALARPEHVNDPRSDIPKLNMECPKYALHYPLLIPL